MPLCCSLAIAVHDGGDLLSIPLEPSFVGERLQIHVNLAYENVDRIVICKIDAAFGTRAVSSDLVGVNQSAKHTGTTTHQRPGKFGKPGLGVGAVEAGEL
jgi:hypothetical protein